MAAIIPTIRNFTFAYALLTMPRFVTCSCGLSSNNFRVEPSSKFVKEGDVVNFTCVVQNFDPSSDFIVWNVSPDKGNTNVAERYDRDSKDMTSVVSVHASKTFQLISCDMHSLKSKMCFSSRTASMRVEYFPREQDLSCGPRDTENLVVGDKMHTYCQVLRGNPGVDMSWRIVPDVPTISLPLARDNSFRRVLSYELPITLQLHKKMLVCEVTSEIVFPNHHLQCLIGPMLILKSPRVMISQHESVINDTTAVRLNCLAAGFPETFNFSWTCLPDGALTGCDSVSGTTYISVNRYYDVLVESLVAEIRCTASNTQGTSSDSVFTTVYFSNRENLEPPMKIPFECPTNLEEKVSVTVNTISDDHHGEIVVTCVIRNITEKEQIRIFWQLGEQQLTEGIAEFPSLQRQNFTSQLCLANSSMKTYNKSLKCVVIICNTTHITFVNLSKHLEDNVHDARDLIGLPPALPQSTVTNVHSFTDYVQEDVQTSAFNVSRYSSPSSIAPSYKLTSIFNDAVTLSTIHQTSYSKSSSKWHVVTVSFVGAFCIIFIIVCLVTLISILMYRHLKKESQRSMNDFIRELSNSHRVSKDDLQDHVYDIPDIELILKANDHLPTSNGTNGRADSFVTSSESSDVCSSYASISPESSWSNSSGIYLSPNTADVSSEMKTVSEKEENFHMYENSRAFQQPHGQRMNVSHIMGDFSRNPSVKKILEIRMPEYPSKIEK